MKALALIILIASTASYASSFRVYNYTYRSKTQVCALTVYVPTTGEIKVEKNCFTLNSK